jgi:hypothetical protein
VKATGRAGVDQSFFPSVDHCDLKMMPNSDLGKGFGLRVRLEPHKRPKRQPTGPTDAPAPWTPARHVNLDDPAGRKIGPPVLYAAAGRRNERGSVGIQAQQFDWRVIVGKSVEYTESACPFRKRLGPRIICKKVVLTKPPQIAVLESRWVGAR